MIRTILTDADPRLREGARPVTTFGPELQRLADDLVETMIAGDGIGIAAPQVGELVRVIVVDWGLALGEGASRPLVLVNPVIAARTRDSELAEEACLSLPRRVVVVPRSSTVDVHAQRCDGSHFRACGDGFVARVLQHEIDHLVGTLITDYAPAVVRSAEPPWPLAWGRA